MSAKPKLIALNLALAAGLILIAWQGRVRWNEAQAERKSSLNIPVKHVTPPPIAPVQKPEAIQAAKYVDIATKNLFSKDRNPTVIVEAPKVEAPRPMPPLPVVYGIMTLPSGTKAIMSDRAGGASKSVREGDSIGDFKILALNAKSVTFDWNGKQVEKNIDELVDHSGGVAASAGASAGPAAPPPPPTVAPTPATLGPPSGTPDAPTRDCQPRDTSPIGTVVDGYRKTGAMTPFGIMNCNWVLNK